MQARPHSPESAEARQISYVFPTFGNMLSAVMRRDARAPTMRIFARSGCPKATSSEKRAARTRLAKAHRVHRPVGPRSVVLDDLKHAGPEPLPRLGRGRMASVLDHAQGKAHVVHHLLGETEQVLLRGTDPVKRLLFPGSMLSHRADYT